MLFNFALNFNHIHFVPAVLISTLFVVLLIAKEIRDERKRA